jgi:hypothetical protein
MAMSGRKIFLPAIFMFKYLIFSFLCLLVYVALVVLSIVNQIIMVIFEDRKVWITDLLRIVTEAFIIRSKENCKYVELESFIACI